MVIISSYSIAILMCIVTMLCWGSWANTQKLAGRCWWPFQLFYWDYAIGVVLLTLFLAISMGSMGSEGRNFLSDLSQASLESVMLALLSGVIFNLANILLVAAIDIAGMAVAFPIAIGLALVIGVLVNYVAHPIGSAWLLFLGVTLVSLAMIADAIAYRYAGTKQHRTSMKGIVISLLAGILMGYFYRFLTVAMSVDFVEPVAGKITPYSAAFIFSVGLFFSNFIFNTVIMRWPFSGTPVRYRAYYNKGSVKLHGIGLLGGAIWGLGLVFNLVAAGSAGYAISYGLGQGATMIAALWGVFIWKEFSNMNAMMRPLIALMFLLYVLGLLAIVFSKLY